MEQTPEEDIFTKYHEEFVRDTQLDELNLKEKSMTVISIKHKWVGRLMRHKLDKQKLENLKKQVVNKISGKLANGDVQLSAAAAKKASYSHETVEKINEEIGKQELLIEYLEKAEKVLNSMTYDIKNAIDIQKLETL